VIVLITTKIFTGQSKVMQLAAAVTLMALLSLLLRTPQQ